MTSKEEDHKSDDLDIERGRLISENHKDLPDMPLCGFMSVRYYQPYFDVDTSDISSRLLQASFYCQREQNFMATVDSRPDGYGPVWIATTLVFVVGVASHLNGWLSSWLRGATMEYNFQSILNASSMIYSFLFCAPALLWLIFRTYEENLKYSSVFCLYGYSLFVFIPAVLLCLLPYNAVTWLVLLAAAGVSTVFLLRNLGPFIVAQVQRQAGIVFTIVGLVQLVFAVSLKWYFFYDK